MDRRSFLRTAIATSGSVSAIPLIGDAVGAQSSVDTPYGTLDGIEPDENGVILPPGFTSRVVAVAGETVGDTAFEWPIFPDGAATFADGNGGWIHTVNSEVFVAGAAGASAVRYDHNGAITDAYPILSGSVANCGGGPTPWGTFLSGEEVFSTGGYLWECDPTGQRPPQAHAAAGIFTHEAAAVDPVGQLVYMTEDQRDGRLYRYSPINYPDLGEGLLDVCRVAEDGSVSWLRISDPSGADLPTRQQQPASTAFLGGEGIWYHDHWIFFTTKHDNKVHGIDLVDNRYRLLYSKDANETAGQPAPLSGVDSLTVEAGSGDIFVAEDGGNMEICVVSPDGRVWPFLRVVDHEDSEVTGPVFNPTGDRLYFSSQRGPTPRRVSDINPLVSVDRKGGGLTFEITGPFQGAVHIRENDSTTSTAAAAATPSSTTPAPAPAPTTTLARVGEGGNDATNNTGAVVIGAGATAALVAVAATVGLRRRAHNFRNRKT